MQYLAVLAAVAAFATTALATPTSNFTSPIADYSNNCKGSLACSHQIAVDCAKAIASVDQTATYTDQAQFSVGNCYSKSLSSVLVCSEVTGEADIPSVILVIYATNGAGEQPVSGAVIIDTTRSILNACSNICGSFGTNNCPTCHVTLNFRS
ncbi:hypothetical protein PYCCODRAFT_842578 [Trametes coccinea BRFM310]|uniref:Uncharacterized protein n=1 Tax=Trametes coccinea (strain BRFM310) TaxID=1353009 RepID=A0A1Y2IE94_TRAC3|nr:hypothetical protein PYCCODRAFT_842578 [Trametes coccinea BRFM310]